MTGATCGSFVIVLMVGSAHPMSAVITILAVLNAQSGIIVVVSVVRLVLKRGRRAWGLRGVVTRVRASIVRQEQRT